MTKAEIDELFEERNYYAARCEALSDALRSLRDHYHAEGDNDHAFSRDECPLCAKIDAALNKNAP